LKSSAAKATKLLKLWPYKAAVVHALQPHDSASKINFCNPYLQSVHDSEVDPLFSIFSDEMCFQLHGHVSSQNNWPWSSVNLYLIHKVPLYDVLIGMWCTVSGKQITGPIFYMGTINSDRYVLLKSIELFIQLMEEE
jgi:hypothetical protein